MTWLDVIRMIRDLAESDFYGLRLKLLAMNPYEMLWVLSLPTLLLWSILRRRGLSHYLWLGVVYGLVTYCVFVSGICLHFSLIAHWLSATRQPPAGLEGMLDGDGPKMITAVFAGGPVVVARYVVWLALLSPAIVLPKLPALRRRKKEPEQATTANNGVGARVVLLKLGQFMQIFAETLIVLAVVAVIAAGPCVWESLRADAALPARSMVPMFLAIGASYLATGLLIRALAMAWIAKGSRAPDADAVAAAGPLSPFLKAALAIVGTCVVVIAVLGWSAKELMTPVVFGLFLAGGAILIALARKQNRVGCVLLYRLASLAGVILLLYLFTFGGAVARLADIHSRLRVAFSGGPATLQSWAVDILAKARARTSQGDFRAFEEGVPKELWSNQIRRLKPDNVRVEPTVLEDYSPAVCLSFASGLKEWQIVIGPKDSTRSTEDFLDYRCRWLRWGSGIYVVYYDQGATIR